MKASSIVCADEVLASEIEHLIDKERDPPTLVPTATQAQHSQSMGWVRVWGRVKFYGVLVNENFGKSPVNNETTGGKSSSKTLNYSTTLQQLCVQLYNIYIKLYYSAVHHYFLTRQFILDFQS